MRSVKWFGNFLFWIVCNSCVSCPYMQAFLYLSAFCIFLPVFSFSNFSSNFLNSQAFFVSTSVVIGSRASHVRYCYSDMEQSCSSKFSWKLLHSWSCACPESRRFAVMNMDGDSPSVREVLFWPNSNTALDNWRNILWQCGAHGEPA